jgi:hypothetical protein
VGTEPSAAGHWFHAQGVNRWSYFQNLTCHQSSVPLMGQLRQTLRTICQGAQLRLTTRHFSLGLDAHTPLPPHRAAGSIEIRAFDLSKLTNIRNGHGAGKVR